MFTTQEICPIGSLVRVTSGRLTGLTGVIIKLTKELNYVLRVEGLQNGVYLVVGSDEVEPLSSAKPRRRYL